MNATARLVAERIEREATETRVYRSLIGAYVKAISRRFAGSHWIPAGGSSPRGVLGQVNAGIEIAEQVSAHALPPPDRIVVPLGTGGTVAGLALGLAIAETPIPIVAVRVVPRVVANYAHVRRLIARTARLIERLTSVAIPRPAPRHIQIVHDYFGGAYGRVTPAGAEVARLCERETGIGIDPTYGAKALAAAVALARAHGGTTLFWLSFDGRWLGHQAHEPDVVALG
jgi:D-cysteine desulfhydrase